MAEYEEQRSMRIEENKRKMRELGIQSMTYEMMGLKNQSKRKKGNKLKSNEVLAKNVEYIADKETEVDHSSEEDFNESVQSIRSLRPRSKKVMAADIGDLVKSRDKPQYSTTSMSSMLKKRFEAQKDIEKQKINKENQRKGLTPLHHQSKQLGQVPSQVQPQRNVVMTIPQQEKEVQSNSSKNYGQSKTMVAPGSLGAYLRLKEKSQERYDLSLDQLIGNSQKRQAGYSGMQLVRENNYFESSDDDAVEEENSKDPDDSDHDAAEMINDFVPTNEHSNDQPVSKKLKNKRGPSMCKDVHDRSINDRKPIILNQLCQPIGPDSATLDEFSRFLGSVARDSNMVPLNKLDWHQVPSKDLIWDYVKTKYMIVEEGKGYVLHTVGTLWRVYKCRIKKMHYKPYNNE